MLGFIIMDLVNSKGNPVSQCDDSYSSNLRERNEMLRICYLTYLAPILHEKNEWSNALIHAAVDRNRIWPPAPVDDEFYESDVRM